MSSFATRLAQLTILDWSKSTPVRIASDAPEESRAERILRRKREQEQGQAQPDLAPPTSSVTPTDPVKKKRSEPKTAPTAKKPKVEQIPSQVAAPDDMEFIDDELEEANDAIADFMAADSADDAKLKPAAYVKAEQTRYPLPQPEEENFNEETGVPMTLEAWQWFRAHKLLPEILNAGRDPRKFGWKEFTNHIKDEMPTEWESLKPLLNKETAKKFIDKTEFNTLGKTDKHLLEHYTEKYNRNMELLAAAYREMRGRIGSRVDGVIYDQDAFRQDWIGYLKTIFQNPDRVHDISAYLLRQPTLEPAVARALKERARGGLSEGEVKSLTPDALVSAVTSYLHNQGAVNKDTEPQPIQFQAEQNQKPVTRIDETTGDPYPLITEHPDITDPLQTTTKGDLAGRNLYDLGKKEDPSGRAPNLFPIPNQKGQRDFDTSILDFIMDKAEGKVDRGYVRPQSLRGLTRDQTKRLESAGVRMQQILRDERALIKEQQKLKSLKVRMQRIRTQVLPGLSEMAVSSEQGRDRANRILNRLTAISQNLGSDMSACQDSIHSLTTSVDQTVKSIVQDTRDVAIQNGMPELEANRLSKLGAEAIKAKVRYITQPPMSRDHTDSLNNAERMSEIDNALGEMFRHLGGLQQPNEPIHVSKPDSKMPDLKAFQTATSELLRLFNRLIESVQQIQSLTARAQQPASADSSENPENAIRQHYGEFQAALQDLGSLLEKLGGALDQNQTPDTLRMGIAKNVRGLFTQPSSQRFFHGSVAQGMLQEILAVVDEGLMHIAVEPGERDFAEEFLADQRGKKTHNPVEAPLGDQKSNTPLDRTNPLLFRKLRDLQATNSFDGQEMASFIAQGLSAGVRNPLNDDKGIPGELPLSSVQMGEGSGMEGKDSILDEGLNQEQLHNQMEENNPLNDIHSRLEQADGAYYSSDPSELRGAVLKPKVQVLGTYTKFNKRSEEANDLLERANQGLDFLNRVATELYRAKARDRHSGQDEAQRQYEPAIVMLHENMKRVDATGLAQELVSLADQIEEILKGDYRPLTRHIADMEAENKPIEDELYSKQSDLKDELSDLSNEYVAIMRRLNAAGTAFNSVARSLTRVLGHKQIQDIDRQMTANNRLTSTLGEGSFAHLVQSAAHTLEDAVAERNKLVMKLQAEGGTNEDTQQMIAMQEQKIGQIAQSLRSQFKSGSIPIDPIQEAIRNPALTRQIRTLQQRLDAARIRTSPDGSPTAESPDVADLQAQLDALLKKRDEDRKLAVEKAKANPNFHGQLHRLVKPDKEGKFNAVVNRATDRGRGFYWDPEKMGARPDLMTIKPVMDSLFHRAGVDIDPITASALFYAMGLDPKEGHQYGLLQQNTRADEGAKAKVLPMMRAFNKKLQERFGVELPPEVVAIVSDQPSRFAWEVHQALGARVPMDDPLILTYNQLVEEAQLSPMQKSLRAVRVNGQPVDPKVARLILQDPMHAEGHFKNFYGWDEFKRNAGFQAFLKEFALTGGMLDKAIANMGLEPKRAPEIEDPVRWLADKRVQTDTDKRITLAEAEAEAWAQVEAIKDRLFANDPKQNTGKLLDYASSYNNAHVGAMGTTAYRDLSSKFEAWSRLRSNQLSSMPIEDLTQYAAMMGLMFADTMRNIQQDREIMVEDDLSGSQAFVGQQHQRGLVVDGIEKFFDEMQIEEPIRQKLRMRYGYKPRQDGSGGRDYFVNPKQKLPMENLVGDRERLSGTLTQVSGLFTDMRILAKMAADGLHPETMTPKQISELARKLSAENLYGSMLTQKVPTLRQVEELEAKTLQEIAASKPAFLNAAKVAFTQFKEAVKAYYAAEKAHEQAIESGNSGSAKQAQQASQQAYSTMLSIASRDKKQHPYATAFIQLLRPGLTNVRNIGDREDLLQAKLTQMANMAKQDTSNSPYGARSALPDYSSGELGNRGFVAGEYPSTAPRLPGNHRLFQTESHKKKEPAQQAPVPAQTPQPVPVQPPVQPRPPLGQNVDKTPKAATIDMLIRRAREYEAEGNLRQAERVDRAIAILAARSIL